MKRVCCLSCLYDTFSCCLSIGYYYNNVANYFRRCYLKYVSNACIVCTNCCNRGNIRISKAHCCDKDITHKFQYFINIKWDYDIGNNISHPTGGINVSDIEKIYPHLMKNTIDILYINIESRSICRKITIDLLNNIIYRDDNSSEPIVCGEITF